MANNWMKDVQEYEAREAKIAGSEAAAFCRLIQLTRASGEGSVLLTHVIDYLIGNPWNTDARGRAMIEEWHNELSEAYPYGLIEYSIMQFDRNRNS
jgi:hypothetical protein